MNKFTLQKPTIYSFLVIFLSLHQDVFITCFYKNIFLLLCTLYHLYVCCVLSGFSHVLLFATQWTVAHQAPLSMAFSRKEYWSGCHALLEGIFLTHGLNPCLLHLLHWQAGKPCLMPPGKPLSPMCISLNNMV